MQYSLMFYQTEGQFAARSDPARREANGAAFDSSVRELQDGGAVVEVRPTRDVAIS